MNKMENKPYFVPIFPEIQTRIIAQMNELDLRESNIKDAKIYPIFLKGEEFNLVNEIVENEYQQIEKTNNKLFDAGQLLQRLIDIDILHWSENISAKLEANEKEVSVIFDTTPFCACSIIKIQENDNNLYVVKNRGSFIVKEDRLSRVIAQEIVSSRYHLRQTNKVNYIHKNLDISGKDNKKGRITVEKP